MIHRLLVVEDDQDTYTCGYDSSWSGRRLFFSSFFCLAFAKFTLPANDSPRHILEGGELDYEMTVKRHDE